MTNEINLLKIANALLKRLWIIILALIVGATAGYFYTDRYVSKTYTATTTMYVYNSPDRDETGEISGADLSVSQKLVNTFLVILKSNTVLEDVKEMTGLNYTIPQLKTMISASSVEETEVFSVSVTCESAENAATIANALADYGPVHMTEIVNGGYISIIDRAQVPTAANSRGKTRNAVIVGLFLAILAAGVVVVVTMLDTRIKDEDDILALDKSIPILGTIPSFEGKSRGGYYDGYGYGYGYGYGGYGNRAAYKSSESKKEDK